MTPLSPAAALARALEGKNRDDIAERAGIKAGDVNRAAGGRPISADYFIRICAVIGHDPVTGGTIEPRPKVGEFDRFPLAMAIHMHMHTRGHSLRAAAKSVELSATVFHRLFHGEITTIESTLAGCRYVGLHPFGYLRPASVPQIVLRETGGGTVPAPKERSAA